MPLQTSSQKPTAPNMTWGRHVRAALLIRGVEIDDLAPQLNISRRTLERTMRGERLPRPWETARIEELLRLPRWFIPDGIDGEGAATDQAGDQDRRLQELRDEVRRGFQQVDAKLGEIAEGQRAASVSRR